ncbi:MAG TPA: ATP-grasp domain-containing protein [Ignavibacteriaceae bacterium]|nr:ATP-grasp domain-containing protein [Ignavibacteriaceae bacterium]
MKTNAKILICYNSPVSIFTIYNGKPFEESSQKNDLSESAFERDLERIVNSLKDHFTDVDIFAANGNIERTISEINKQFPDVIFNFVETIEGVASYEYCFAGVYELLGINYTGNTPITLGNCLNKERTKNILRSFNIPTPNSKIIRLNDKVSNKNFNLKFPVILKLLTEDASIGISELSVVNDLAGLRKQLKFLFETYNQDVIAEEYINGRELNVAILGDRILPISEILFKGLPKGLPKIITYDSKWMEDSVYYQNTIPSCPAKLNKKIQKNIEAVALSAYQAINCRDYARVDIRLDKKGSPYVIEVNPNPDISTDSGFARASAAAGLTYSELLKSIANFALSRKRNDTKNKAS